MTEKNNGSGFSRRDFVKTVGIAGLAVAGTGVTGAFAAPEQPASPAKTGAMPKRRLGKTGAEVSILNLGGMFDTINNQLMLKQALNWGDHLLGHGRDLWQRVERGRLRPLLRPQPRGPQGGLPGHQARYPRRATSPSAWTRP